MALKAVDWSAWQSAARDFLRAHPNVAATSLTRSERIVVPGARAAWAVVHFQAASAVRAHGGQPCVQCGHWTGSFCEGCSGLPEAICTSCDKDRLLCHSCISEGKLYGEVERSDMAGFLEITGFNDEAGRFVRYDQPVRFPTSAVPRNRDGTFNIEELMAFAVGRLGIETPSDFHHFWPSTQRCYEELERLVGRGLDSQEAMRVAVAWTNARRLSLQEVESLGLQVAQHRQSSVGGPTRAAPEPVVPSSMAPPPVSNKIRRLTPSGLTAPAHAPLVNLAAQSDVYAKEDAAKQAKLDALFGLVLEHVVHLPELGLTPAQLADPMQLQRLKNTLMSGASRLSGQRLPL
eukprot:s4807_g6.t1